MDNCQRDGRASARLGRQAAAVAPVIVYLFAMLIVFRRWVFSGFDLGFGDRADGIIEISLLEHWNNVLAGHAVWNQPLYFWPYPDTLGYNDGYFLFGVDYAIWRSFLDPFRADMMNMVVFRTIGFWAAYRLAGRSLDIDRGPAAMVALLFTIATGTLRQADHAQLQTIALLPVAATLAIAVIRREARGRRGAARLLAVALGLLIGAWLMTAYYMAWFSLFFSLLFALCWLAVSGAWRPTCLFRLMIRHGATAAIFVVALAVASIPFLLVYLPKAAESGAHTLADTRPYLTWFFDAWNVGEDHYLWGWLLYPLRWLFGRIGGAALADAKLHGEHVTGLPLVLLILTAASIPAAARRRDLPALRALALAIGIGWLLTLQAGPASPWALVYWLVPGATGLRVVVRFQLFLILPVLLMIALTWRGKIRLLMSCHPLLAGAAAAVLVVEQLSPVSSAGLSRAAQRGLFALPRPPAGCASFYVVKARPAEPPYKNPDFDAMYPHNVDAMLLAMMWRVPTLNGAATFAPPDARFAAPTSADYDTRALLYIAAHRLRGVCRLDARSLQPWRRIG